MQAGLPLDEKDADEIVEVFRISPTAVAQSLSPMEMIVTGREQDAINDEVDSFHRDYFRQRTYQALQLDFHRQELAEFYYETLRLRELEVESKLVLKNERMVERVATFSKRLTIGQAAEEFGGGFIHVAMLKNAPQPWELGGDPSANANRSLQHDEPRDSANLE